MNVTTQELLNQIVTILQFYEFLRSLHQRSNKQTSNINKHMTSRRKRKKGECAHLKDGPRFLVTDDPYPIYNSELYCKRGRFDWTWGNHESEEFPCDKCKRFTLSRKKIREANKEAKERRRHPVCYDDIDIENILKYF